jgi:hypothetical protein
MSFKDIATTKKIQVLSKRVCHTSNKHMSQMLHKNIATRKIVNLNNDIYIKYYNIYTPNIEP